MKLIEYTNKGLYCAQADIYIDPHKKVNYALITHAHADHARWGHQHYLCTPTTAPILKHRLGPEINVQTIKYGDEITINSVKFSFHPAGHIIGSAMIRAEYKGEIWLVSGDYKIEDDGLSEAYEPVSCHHFITECTFGSPLFSWSPQEEIFKQINHWWSSNAMAGRSSVLSAYSLGKAQRIINSVDASIGPIITHGAVEKINQIYRSIGFALPDSHQLNASVSSKQLRQALIIASPAAMASNWSRKIKGYTIGIASGWMVLPDAHKRRGADIGFVLSDHCGFPDLLSAIKDSGAEHIYAMHGDAQAFCKHLSELGYNAQPIEKAKI